MVGATRAWTRLLALFAVGVHAIVLPALYYGFNMVVTRSDTDLFVQHVRTLSRNPPGTRRDRTS